MPAIAAVALSRSAGGAGYLDGCDRRLHPAGAGPAVPIWMAATAGGDRPGKTRRRGRGALRERYSDAGRARPAGWRREWSPWHTE